MSLSTDVDEAMAAKLHTLALERGELNVKAADDPIDIVEKSSNKIPKAPSLPEQQGSVEGHRPRKVRFSQP